MKLSGWRSSITICYSQIYELNESMFKIRIPVRFDLHEQSRGMNLTNDLDGNSRWKILTNDLYENWWKIFTKDLHGNLHERSVLTIFINDLDEKSLPTIFVNDPDEGSGFTIFMDDWRKNYPAFMSAAISFAFCQIEPNCNSETVIHVY